MYSGKLVCAVSGAEDAIEPADTCGNFSLNHAARFPGYDPPIVTTLLLVVPRASVMFWITRARSANACSDDRYFRFAVDMFMVG